MTSIELEIQECLVCQRPMEVGVIVGSTEFGPPDLDARSAPMLRDAIAFEIVRCENCGYCWNPDPDEGSGVDVGRAAEIVDSQAYRDALSTKVPEPAPEFLARSVLEAALADYSAAGWNALKAAWVCDDEGIEAAARDARALALGHWTLAVEGGQSIFGQEGGEVVLRVDLMRRNGDFAQALELIDVSLPDIEDSDIRAILEFCWELCDSKDNSAHTVGEAFERVS